VALAVLVVAGAGALIALIAANDEMRNAQLRQMKTMLVDAKAQRMVLASKAGLKTLSTLKATQQTDPATQAVGAGDWLPDDSTSVSGDYGTGAVFEMHADGTVVQKSTAPSSCADAAVKTGQYCREVLVASGLPPSSTNKSPASTAYTRWIRVSRKGELPHLAVVYREVFLP
jgi:hypothetical protein